MIARRTIILIIMYPNFDDNSDNKNPKPSQPKKKQQGISQE